METPETVRIEGSMSNERQCFKDEIWTYSFKTLSFCWKSQNPSTVMIFLIWVYTFYVNKHT